jgi:hypothetical protein
MLKVNMKAIVSNRGDKEVGTVIKRWRRKGVVFYNIKLERGYLMENVTCDSEKPYFLLEELSIKFNNKK